jgi:hypothetical protein
MFNKKYTIESEKILEENKTAPTYKEEQFEKSNL